MFRVILFISFYLCLVLTTKGQAARIFDNRDYGVSELSSSLITDIIQDRYGYIWIATAYGLNKFDGIRFSQYLNNPLDSSSVGSNNVTSLHRDIENRLWIGCSNGLQYYDENVEKFIRISFPDNISPHITDITDIIDVKNNNTIWVTTSGWGIFEIDIDARKAIYLEKVTWGIGNGFGRKIIQDRQHTVWIATDRHGISSFDMRTNITTDYTATLPLSNGAEYSILDGEDGYIYFATDKEMTAFKIDSKESIPIRFEQKENPIITDLARLANGQILIATDGEGLLKLDSKELQHPVTRATLQNLDKSYDNARIHTLLQDRDSNIWLGWFQRGLVYIPAQSTQFNFWPIVKKNEIDKKVIDAIVTNEIPETWYSINGVGLFHADSNGNTLNFYNEYKDISAFTLAEDGKIWFASRSKGIGIIEPDDGYPKLLGICNNMEVVSLALSNTGNLYISTFGNGFFEYNIKKSSYRHFNMNNPGTSLGNLANDWINVIFCDSQGLVWLGHHKGVSCYDPQKNSFFTPNDQTKLSDQICLSLLEDGNNNIWVGTYNGLYKYTPANQQLESFTTFNGLSSNVVTGLAKDQEGNIWCSTFRGINYLDTHSGKIITFYSGDGLVDRSYNRSVYTQDFSGRIYFAGQLGVTSFMPNEIHRTKYTQNIFINNLYIKNQNVRTFELKQRLKIYNTSLATSKNLYLTHYDDNFTLELSTIDFDNPENIHYEYRLNDTNDQWNATLPGVNLITYNNLPPGSHVLSIRACKFGSYSPSRTININIVPPWYRSSLAYVGYFLAIVGMTWMFLRYLHHRRMEKLNTFKLQLFTDISHEIRSPLTLVLSPLDKLIKGSNDPSKKEILTNIRRNALRMLRLVNQLLDTRKLETGHLTLQFTTTNLAEYVSDVAEDFHQLAIERNIDFKIISHKYPIFAKIDTKHFEKIIHNLISNAFKYTPEGGEIKVEIKTSPTLISRQSPSGSAIINVTDTGPGIAQNETNKIFKRFYQGENQSMNGGSGIGLHLSKVLVNMHNGNITVENRIDSTGSIFTVQLPLITENEQAIATTKVTPEIKQTTVVSEPSNTQKKKSIPSYKKTDHQVLIVDDDPLILQYLTNELDHVYKTLKATDGATAFQLALSQMPDLIISDVSMPAMDGLMLVKKIKDNAKTNHIPVILLTAKTDQQDRINGLGIGADAYLTKPFEIEELEIICENLIKNRQTVKGKFSGAQNQEGKIKTITFKSSDEQLMERVVNTVNKYLDNPDLNVQLLADEVGLSRVQLHRKIKQLTGITTGEFIRNVRLKQAEQLLLKKKMNISQVAYSLGFINHTHFSALFKKVYGLSPSDYINRHADEEKDKNS